MDFYNSRRVKYNALISRWEKEDAYMENKLDNLFTTYEMLQCQSTQTLRDIETKIYVEGGTFEDIDYLYTEAEEQNEKNKDGILTRIINFFKNLIKKIREKFASLFGGEEDVELNVPKEQLGMVDRIIKHWANIKAAFQKILSGNVLTGLAELVNVAKFEFAAVGAAAAFITIRKSKLKEKYKVLQDINDTIDKVVSKVDDFRKKNIKEGGVLDKLITGAKTLKDNFFNAISAAFNAVGNWFNNIKKKDDNKSEESNENDNKDSNDNESEDTGNNGGNTSGSGNNSGNNSGNSGNNGGNTGKKKEPSWKDMTTEQRAEIGLLNNGSLKNYDAFFNFMVSKGLLTDKQISDYKKLTKNVQKKNWLTSVRFIVGESHFGFWDEFNKAFFEDFDEDDFGFWN